MAKIVFLLVTVEKSAEADRQPLTHRNRVDMDDAEEAANEGELKSLVADDVTLAQLYACGKAQCSMREIAAILSTTQKALKTFMKQGTKARLAYEQGRAEGLKTLRDAQITLAQKSVPMATLLGRLYLGQSEQREQDETPPAQNRGAADRLKRRLLGIIAENTAGEGVPGDPGEG